MTACSETLTLRSEPAQVGVARRLVRRTCSDAGVASEMCDVAVLLTSETVTNAVLHGGTELILSVTADLNVIRVEVSDDNPHQPAYWVPEQTKLSGRGMSIVASQATRWGVAPAAVGRMVWFELMLGVGEDGRDATNSALGAEVRPRSDLDLALHEEAAAYAAMRAGIPGLGDQPVSHISLLPEQVDAIARYEEAHTHRRTLGRAE